MGTATSNNAALTVYNTGLPCGSGYGTSRYDGSYKAECSLRSKRHYYALKKIFPMDYLAGELDNDLEIEGYWLDSCEESAWQLLEEIFADTTQLLIADWERVYDVSPDPTATLSERRDAILAAIRSTGATSIDDFENIASGYGYTITITEGLGNLFVVASTSPPATQLPGRLFTGTERWVWYVEVSGATTTPDETFENAIREQMPAHTRVEFSYV